MADLGLARNLDEDGIFLREKHVRVLFPIHERMSV